MQQEAVTQERQFTVFLGFAGARVSFQKRGWPVQKGVVISFCVAWQFPFRVRCADNSEVFLRCSEVYEWRIAFGGAAADKKTRPVRVHSIPIYGPNDLPGGSKLRPVAGGVR